MTASVRASSERRGAALPRAAAKPALILVHPQRNEYVRAYLRALSGAGMLALFVTTIATRGGGPIRSMLPRRIRAELDRRNFSPLDRHRIKSFPVREIVKQIALRVGATGLTRHESGWASTDRIAAELDAKAANLIARGGIDASGVYAHDDGALRIFEAARRAGLRRFYELPIGYWRAAVEIFAEERERKPEWASTLFTLRDSAAKHARKDAELALADHIMVPSDFVRDTLRLHPGLTATIDVLPYGAPPPVPAPAPDRPPGAKLRLLFVGSLTQRKGLSYLFDAMRRVEGLATLTLVGGRPLECSALDAELKRHRWLRTMPHDQVLATMERHDVFVFPSLFEGSALVLLEALSRGLPVITTPNAGPMAIEEGKDGFIVPIRDPDAIAARVTLLAGDRDRLAAMRQAALAKAAEVSWPRREATFIRYVRDCLERPA